jgi:hypothetical protein
LVRYFLDDNEDLQGPVSGNTACSEGLREALKKPRGRTVGAGKLCCGKFKRVGHNRQTCHTVLSASDQVLDTRTGERSEEVEMEGSENMHEPFVNKQESQVLFYTALGSKPGASIPIYSESSDCSSSNDGN